MASLQSLAFVKTLAHINRVPDFGALPEHLAVGLFEVRHMHNLLELHCSHCHSMCVALTRPQTIRMRVLTHGEEHPKQARPVNHISMRAR